MTEPTNTTTPRAGQSVYYKGEYVGKVVRVDGNLCYRTYPNGDALPFIWRFWDGPNKLHTWG